MDVLQTMRESILTAFKALPLLLVSYTAFLAIGLGNMGLFVLFIGQALIVPLSTELLHMGIDRVYSPITDILYHVKNTDIVHLVPTTAGGLGVNVTPSYWMAHFLFFMAYLLANAVSIRSMDVEKGVPEPLAESRKAKATTVIVMVVFITLGLTWFRYSYTNAETIRGIAAAFVVSGGLGYAWYQFAAMCGARHADVFGVVQQIVPVSAKEEKPMTCVYAPKP